MERTPSPRDRAAQLSRDPKGYFDEARRWAGRKAKADVDRELGEKEAGRNAQPSPVWRLAQYALHAFNRKTREEES